MVDPSTLLAPDGMEWVALNRELGVEIVISGWFGEWLDGRFDVEPYELVAAEDRDGLLERVERLRAEGVAAELRRFDHHEVRLDAEAMEVQERLIDFGHPAAPIWADEWAYLQSHSWLTSKLRLVLDSFEEAGAVVLEFSKEVGMRMITEVIPAEHVPPSLTPELVGRAAVKWIVVGGATIGGGTVGALLGGPLAGHLAEFLGDTLGNKVAKAAVVKFDP
jgi:hypothetical protein